MREGCQKSPRRHQAARSLVRAGMAKKKTMPARAGAALMAADKAVHRRAQALSADGRGAGADAGRQDRRPAAIARAFGRPAGARPHPARRRMAGAGRADDRRPPPRHRRQEFRQAPHRPHPAAKRRTARTATSRSRAAAGPRRRPASPPATAPARSPSPAPSPATIPSMAPPALAAGRARRARPDPARAPIIPPTSPPASRSGWRRRRRSARCGRMGGGGRLRRGLTILTLTSGEIAASPSRRGRARRPPKNRPARRRHVGGLGAQR